MEKLTRGIDRKFAAVFTKTAVYKLLIKHPRELFLGIRNNYINIYYRGLRICKGTIVDGRFRAEIASRYLGLNGSEGYVDISASELARKYRRIRKNIDKHYANMNKEKDMLQRLVNNNNGNRDSEWVCVDIKYRMQRGSGAEPDPVKFDIIAFTKVAPHRVALIELKCEAKTIGGKIGIVKHLYDYYEFFKSGDFENYLMPELIDIVRSYGRVFPDNPHMGAAISADTFSKKPEFFFITLEDTEDRAKDKLLRHIRDDVPGAAENNLTRELGFDITTQNDEGFNPIFLFSDNDSRFINMIIGDDNYQIGF